MELIFNEISFKPYSNSIELKEKFLEMLKLYRELKDKYNLKNLLFPSETSTYEVLNEHTKFINWVQSLDRTSKDIILSVVNKRPYTEEILNDNEQDTTSKYYYENTEISIEQEYCIGLGICHSKGRIAISLNNHKCWNSHIITFKKILDNDFNTQPVNVYNICKSEQELNRELLHRLEYYNKDLQLVETNVLPKNKEVKLSGDHHGNNKLREFAQKLLQNKYVKQVINNIDFSPNCSNLIKRVYDDGTIDIVLYWEDAGYGMKIQTTGRNYRETEAIAEILKKEFDKQRN